MRNCERLWMTDLGLPKQLWRVIMSYELIKRNPKRAMLTWPNISDGRRDEYLGEPACLLSKRPGMPSCIQNGVLYGDGRKHPHLGRP